MFCILAFSNLAHFVAYNKGTVTEYSKGWDQPQLKILNLILVLVLVLLAVIKPKEVEDNG